MGLNRSAGRAIIPPSGKLDGVGEMRALSVFAAVVMVAAGFGSYALVPYWQDVDRTVPAPTGPVVGELAYWHEGETVEARVMKYTQEGVKILEARQTDLPLKGILITRVVFPECGMLKFQQSDLGTIYGFAEAEEAEKYPWCPIKDWSGTWRIGRII
ncbi:hypothetical protein KZ843_06725 [Pseudomonas aeruginosa]|nr:hypothetical protein [Pseudomonas aeruginosa]MBW6122586.1 hypothetical protein [Pseudomonas aeruginosa]